MELWKRHFFRASPLLDLAIVRIAALTATIFYCFIFYNYFDTAAERIALDDTLFRPTFLYKLFHLPFGWGYDGSGGSDGLGAWAIRPGGNLILGVSWALLISAIFALIGFFTRTSLMICAVSFFYLQSYMYSFGDYHHPEAAMFFMILALALSPSGGVLSVDNYLRRRSGTENDLHTRSTDAGWAIKFMQWFFVLMYFSAFWAKLTIGGLSWMNGYTLQFYLIQDGLRHGGALALWMSQYHTLIMLGQIAVMIFQATFFLEVVYPKIRWLYIPAGFSLHIAIYVLQGAPFFTWMALYTIFIPWRDGIDWIKGQGRFETGQVQA